MLTLYFEEVDLAGHDFGPVSSELGYAVATVDANLGRLLDGIALLPHADDVFLVLVSDHGMMSQHAAADVLDMQLFPGVRLGQAGPYASLYVDEGGLERAVTVRDSIAAMMPENGVYLRADVPERLHYSADPRVGDIVIVAAEGRTIVAPDRVPERDGFNHGWDNAFTGMGGIFLAQGPGITAGLDDRCLRVHSRLSVPLERARVDAERGRGRATRGPSGDPGKLRPIQW
jgi:predicted AlkP superfamily pyrophosphatase or phosphodiesterase